MQPNNLENTYNSSYKMTDAEYTTAINNGKDKSGTVNGKKYYGKYTRGTGSVSYFTKDYCGYGICQWTSLGRRANLLNKCKEKKTSIADLNMQLEFLSDELRNSYPSVWATLCNVPDTATGAYLAGVHFCAAFEIPANTYSTAASRGKITVTKYWNQYSGEVAEVSGVSHLGIVGYNYPVNVKSGAGMTVNGYVLSNYTINSVSAKILNSSGSTVYSKSWNPSSTAAKLSNADDDLLFSKLPAGSYKYVITAKDSFGGSVKASHSFKVSSSAANIMRGVTTNLGSSGTKVEGIMLSGASYPTTLTKGSGLAVSGMVRSDKALTEVTASILNSAGEKVYTKTVSPDATYCDLGKFDSALLFSKLPIGTYRYRIFAANSEKSETLMDKSFKVIAASKLKISGASKPKNMKKGKSFTVKGTVTSNYNLKKVYVIVKTTTGKKKINVSKTLSGVKTYDISNLDSKVKFGKLPKGTYYYIVKATDTYKTKTLIKKKFKVK